VKVSLFILFFFIFGLAAYYLKYKNERTEFVEFNYSKTDSTFNAINFSEDNDSLKVDKKVEFKTKEFPKAKININKDGEDELAKLPGIGIKTAEKILEYRNKIKQFKNIFQLKNVKGISEGKFGKIKNYIVAE